MLVFIVYTCYNSFTFASSSLCWLLWYGFPWFFFLLLWITEFMKIINSSFMHSFNMFMEHLLWARFMLNTGKKPDINCRDYRTYITSKYKITHWWALLREGMVISQFIKGRFDEIGDNRKGCLEEGMIKQKSEKIAFK